MNAFKKGWFTENDDLWPGMCNSLQVEKVLYEGKSKYQEILVLETKHHGTALILDNIIQCTLFDEFSYQEMISFLPLCSHPNPKKVLIVGGGDGGVAREVTKFPTVEHVDQVEIDEEVVNVCRKYLPSMAKGFDHPKVKLHITDGFQFISAKKNEYDVIITDSSDPIGPAVALFGQNYFNLLKNALKKGGVVCCQNAAQWYKCENFLECMKQFSAVFSSVAYAISRVPTYPEGNIGFSLGSAEPNIIFKEPLRTLTDQEVDELDLKYYSSEVHKAAFALPKFFRDRLTMATGKN